MAARQQFQEIIEAYGGVIANKAIETLLKDTQITELKPLSEFIARNWRDCFSPAMMNLGCQFVGGNAKDTEELAVSISLMNLSFRLWDDIIDQDFCRTLRPTFVGKFGKNTALIYGGIVSAKAFTLVKEADLGLSKKCKINDLFWNYWATMAKSEIKDLNAKTDKYSAANKLNKIKAETINVQTCLKIGAIIGNGSTSDIKLLENYGFHLGMILELINDVRVSLNLTLELEKKIKQNQLPLLLLLGREESGQIKEEIEFLSKKQVISSEDMGHLIEILLNSVSWKQLASYYKEESEKCQIALSTENITAQTLLMIAKYQSESFWEITKNEDRDYAISGHF
jgi:geranylgeranyl pyrophosphate synthase